MGHRIIAADDFVAGDIDHQTAGGFGRSPTGWRIAFRHAGDKTWLTVLHRQPVEVAAVLIDELRDETRPPAGDETILVVEGGQAREQSVDDP